MERVMFIWSPVDLDTLKGGIAMVYPHCDGNEALSCSRRRLHKGCRSVYSEGLMFFDGQTDTQRVAAQEKKALKAASECRPLQVTITDTF